MLFSLGAFRDALWLKRNNRSPAPRPRIHLESPLRCLALLSTLAAVSIFTVICLPAPHLQPSYPLTVRNLPEAICDPQFATRGVTHCHESAPGIEGGFDVPLAAFKFAHGGPSIETPPPELGADTDRVLADHGYDPDQIAAFRRARVI